MAFDVIHSHPFLAESASSGELNVLLQHRNISLTTNIDPRLLCSPITVPKCIQTDTVDERGNDGLDVVSVHVRAKVGFALSPNSKTQSITSTQTHNNFFNFGFINQKQHTTLKMGSIAQEFVPPEIVELSGSPREVPTPISRCHYTY